MADTVLATVKAMGGRVAPGDLEDIPAEELKRLERSADSYQGFHTADNYVNEYNSSPAVERCAFKFKQMEDDAYLRLKQLYPDGAGSPTMAAIKKNLIIQYSILRTDASPIFDYGVNLKSNYKDLMQDDRCKDMMNLIVPTLETHRLMIPSFRQIRPRENA